MQPRKIWLRRPLAVAFALLAVLTFSPTAQQAARPPAQANRQLFLEQFARGYFPGRSGQIVVVPREGTIITKRDPAVTYMHGSPWPYDSRIPFLIYGAAFIRQGTYPQAVVPQDVAPTLATLAGVPMPATSSGRSLQSVIKTSARPRLIVLAVLDGMRLDYFDRHASELPTLSRLRRSGAWFSNARLNYLPSITSVAHATISTGADPRVHGIVANAFYDRVAGGSADVYPGLSPRNLMALTLADAWNIYTDGKAVIIGQGSTPRATVPLAGHGACILNGRKVIAISYSEKTGGWETNAECYRLPEYLEAQNARALWEAAGGNWMGHSIANASAVRRSPVLSKFETDALKLVVAREPLGADDITDLLFVNFKTPDYIGHAYGPDSPELRAGLAALDRDLGEVLAALDAKVGAERYVLAITADHGMPAEPDSRRGQRRVYNDDIVKLIHDKFDPQQAKLVRQYEPENAQLAIDQDRLRELRLELETLRKFLEAQPFIFAAYTEDELRGAAAALR